jgi:AcrR family transcriptional regulator
MTTRTLARLDRLARRPIEKFNERRAELAEAALQTLSELGYARTSVREIAQNSAFTHGVLHYYFNDKVDLILCSVRQYKARCVTRYDAIVAQARSVDELIEGFLDALGRTIQDEARLHRLWYDIRAQAMFDASFRADIADIDKSLEDMIWRILERLFALAGMAPTVSSSASYAIMDGLFQQALLKQLSGETNAVRNLQTDVRAVLTHIVGIKIVPRLERTKGGR